MFHISRATSALALAAIGVLSIAPSASADPSATQTLTPPPPAFYSCQSAGAETVCTATLHEVKVSEPQPELVCGTGAQAFVIHDNGLLEQHWTRWYDRAGNLTRRVVHERWTQTFWSNPLSGKTLPYTQTDKITDDLMVPGDFGSAVETTVGENIYTDPVTHQKVLTNAGRTVFGADGSLEFRAGQQPFVDAFVDGDPSVFDAVCAALA